MQKYIYKLFILTAIFIAALIFMSRNIKEEEITLEKAVTMEEATFPLMYLKSDGYTINRLHGYSSNIDANTIREALTPLRQEKELDVEFSENETVIKKIKYEIRELEGNTLLEGGTISGLNTTKEGKSAKIKLNTNLATSTEYAMKITAVTDQSRKIYFYTRVKYYETDYFLKEKLDFIERFHQRTFDKEKAEGLAMYLETDKSEDNANLARVTIHSSFDLLTWGNTKPEIITEVVPTVKELNVETSSVQLEYFVKIETDSGTEVYNIKEFYRIRYTKERIYLLNYERDMEACFDTKLISMAKSEFKIGVTAEDSLKLVTSAENGRVAFVRNGELWYYDLKENRMVQVFSFRSAQNDYLRGDYDQHDIQILSMDDGGNINFIVYGYMNRGDYEGKVALVLYHFSSDTKRIEELVYIPLETTYQMLKEDMNDFSYVSQRGIFYFTICNQVYSYNITSKKLTILTTGITEDNFAVLTASHGLAWIDQTEGTQNGAMIIMDLETEDRVVIKALPGEEIRVLGEIQSNVLYGYVKTTDRKENTDGSIIIPAYKVEIADISGSILKSYQQKNIYVVDATVEDNIVKLERVKKSESEYTSVAMDSILSQGRNETAIIGIKTRTTELMLTEKYLSLPDGFAMEKRPAVYTTTNLILKEDTTLRLGEDAAAVEKYYVYALGEIVAAFSQPSEAIQLADEKMGVVVSSNNRLVWERSGRFNRKAIGRVKETYAKEGVTSIGACIAMVLQHNQIPADAIEWSESNKSIYQVLKENVKNPVNLKGCNLDQTLYLVSGGNLVLAMKNDKDAVLITGYDETMVTYFDPQQGNVRTSISAASHMFENAGNIFLSYIN